MNKQFIHTFLKFSMASLFGLVLTSAVPVLGADGVWTNAAGGSWTDSANWTGGVIADGTGAIADFTTLGLSADAAVTLDGDRTIGTLLFGDTLDSHNWDLGAGSGGILTMAVGSGFPTITVSNRTVTIGCSLAGTSGLYKDGDGTVVFTGTNSYSSTSYITNGTVTYSGAAGNTGSGYLYLGGNSGRAVINMDSSGTVNLGPGGGKVYIGGTAVSGGGSDTGAGVINQTSGTLVITAGQNTRFGDGGPASYGSYNLQGGTLDIPNTVVLGYGGIGVFNQSGGALTVTKYFALGSYNDAVGVATFTGGTAALGGSSGDISIGDGGSSGQFGTFNVGTLAGGDAVVTANASGSKGTRVGTASGSTANLNLNSGTFVVNNWIYRPNSGANAYVNFDGGTLQAGSTCTLLNNNLSGAYVYRDGAVIDSQGYTATSLANLQSAPGNGIYPSGGGWAYTDGAGYIGAPAVTVSGGSGSGAQAVAIISGGQVTGVEMTCPGQNYLAGDNLTFDFSGGGPTTPAASFMHTLTAGEVAANNAGGLVKLGSGTLILSGANTYNGLTAVNEGTLLAMPANGGASGDYTVAGGATLKVQQSFAGDALALNALTLNSGSSLTLDETNLSAPLIVVTNALTTASTVTLNLDSLTPVVGQYPLVQYGSLAGAGFGAITLGSTPSAPGLALSLSNNAANQSIDLVVVATVSNLKWNGNVSSSWDIGGTANWQGGAFYTETGGVGPIVNFDDSASGPYTAITLGTTVSPTTMVVSNNILAYSIGGSGQIAGNGGLLKQGSGTLTLATANTFTNQVLIENGTLQLGDGSASNGSVTGDIVDGSALIVANPNAQTMDNAISGIGSLTKSGNGTLTLTSSNTLSGAVSVNAGTLALNQGGTAGSIPVLGSVSSVNISSGATLALSGENTLGDSNSLALPPVTVAGGGTLSSSGSGLQSVGNLNIGDSSAGGVLSGAGGIIVNGSLTNESASMVDVGNLTYNGTSIFLGGYSSELTVNGNLSLVYPSNVGTVISGDPYSSPGTLTTKGNVTGSTPYIELDYMTWNVDLGTNTLNLNSKVTIGKVGGLPAYLNWISGNGLIAINGYFTLADSFIGVSGPSQGELDVSGGSLVISNNTARCLIGNAGTATINVSGGTLSFLGNNSIQLGGDVKYPSSGASGTLTISGDGLMVVGSQSGGLNLAADKGDGSASGIVGTINLNGGTLMTWPSIINGSTDGGGSSYINFNGGTLKAGTNNPTFLQGLTLATVQSGGAVIDDGGNVITIGQSLTDGGGGGLTKLGSGTLILTNDNTYSGMTTVSNGTLEVDGSLSTSPVTVDSGATLSGIGSFGADVTLDSGSTLAPGTNAPGTLTVNGNLSLGGSLMIAVNKSLAQSNSTAMVSGTLSNTGTGVVVVTNLGPDLVVGDSFQLFNQPLANGNAMSVATSDGVTWTNKLAVDGTIQVLSVTPPINPLPGVVQFNLSGNMLELSWPTNRGWILQAQTNALSTGLNTNWVDVPGSDSVTNMTFNVDSTQGAIFYRMVYP